MIRRRKARQVSIGKVKVGGGAPISVQSMTKTDTRDVSSTIAQIHRLEEVGCEIVRVAVPDEEAVRCLKEIKSEISIPLVADVHFRPRLALEAIEMGVDALRINPGNMGVEGAKEVVREARKAGIPLRIGVNAGSIKLRGRNSKFEMAEEMVKSALQYVQLFEGMGYRDIIISLKASDVPTTVQAYQLMAKHCSYPFHLGITEAGPPDIGSVKSAVGIGILLWEGIGDTLRVSLTGPPEEEVRAGYEILKSLKLREYGPHLISCPTCGRCKIEVEEIVREFRKKLSALSPFLGQLPPLTVAIMGCEVNGPGEAKLADVGIAGGKRGAVVFKQGKIIKRVGREEMVEVLIAEIKGWMRENAVE